MNISIIIPCKNEASILPSLLDALIKQTSPAHEIIVVNSGSTDTTVAVANTYKKKANILVITAKQPGVAEARNAGGRAATGKMLLFIDADSEINPEFLAVLKMEMTTRSLDTAGVAQRMKSQNIGLRTGARIMNAYARCMAHTPWPIAISMVVTSKKTFDAIDGFDPKIWIMEDYDFALRAHRAGAKFGIVSNTYFISSDRRYRDASSRHIIRGFYAEMYRYTHKLRITKPLYDYKMGGDSRPRTRS